MAASLELARRVYTLLVDEHQDGLTRMALAKALGTDDRSARDAVNSCRLLAAANPRSDGRTFIIGFDPESSRYCAAQDPYQARRIIAYQESRVRDIVQALEAQKTAFERSFRQNYQDARQEGLF